MNNEGNKCVAITMAVISVGLFVMGRFLKAPCDIGILNGVSEGMFTICGAICAIIACFMYLRSCAKG